jgi:predicted alpha/beta superfamily hydrolase
MKKLLCCSIGMPALLLLGISLHAQESKSAAPPTPSVDPTVPVAESSRTLAIGEYRSMVSAIYGERIEYFLKLPEHYETSPRRYPVLFVMNGDMPSVAANAYATMETLGSEMVPEMILIGIAVPKRASIFPGNPNGQGRGADTLVRFVTEELVPHVDARYRTQKYRILFGQSNAGLFAVYAFLTRPQAFDACIAASPTFGWQLDFMKETARTSFAKNRDLRKRLYLDYGGRDYGQLVRDAIPVFADLLRREAPAGLLWKSEALALDGHVPVASLNNGLLFVFPDFLASDELKAAGLKAVDAHFASLSQRYGIQLQAPEETVFDLSHKLFREKKYGEAIAGFEAVLERYPESFRARLFLGDAYRDSGNIAKAKETYRQCLRSDPAFEPAKQRLDQLPQR